MPIIVTVEFTSWNTANVDMGGNAELGGKFGDIAKIFKISPKINFGTWAQINDFTNYGDGWRDVPPGPAPDY